MPGISRSSRIRSYRLSRCSPQTSCGSIVDATHVWPAWRSMRSSRRTLASRSSTIRILAARISDRSTIHWFLHLIHPAFYIFQRHIQRLHELIDLDGLGEIAEESRLQARLDVPRYRVGAECEDRDVSRCRVVAQDHHGLGAADAGQIDIHQYHLRPGGARELD